VKVAVTAANAAGPTTAESAPTAVVVEPQLVNLAPNPGFESTWTTDWAKSGVGTFTWATDLSRSPTHALKLRTTGSALARWLTKPKRIPVAAGASYLVSAWLRTLTVAGSARLTVAYFNASGAVLGTVATAPLNLSGTNDWTELSFTVVAPAGAKHARMEFRLNGPGTIWVDDAFFAQL
jgi:hypothetical protein